MNDTPEPSNEPKPLNKNAEWQLPNKAEWQPPLPDRPSSPNAASNNSAYGPRDERAPILRWLISAILLIVIAGGAIWLASKVIVPSQLPELSGRESAATDPSPVTPPTQPEKTSDEEAWLRALEKDTLEGYREYLAAFPDGKFADNAQDEIDAYDDRAFATAEQRATIAGYEDYLAAWPEGRHASQARERIAQMKARADAIAKDAAERAAQEKADWDAAARANDVPAYQTYLSKHPSGPNAAEAQSRIAALQASAADQSAWLAAKAANRAQSYEQYMTSYPQGVYIPQAIAALEQLKPAIGRAFQDCPTCPQMVTLPSGTANLGAAEGEADARPNEGPQHSVTFSNLFAMGVNEVTFSQWQSCVSEGSCSTQPRDNGWGAGNRPVINISWDDAQGYANWLSQKTGHSYSLPSEAQWEYAARGGESSAYIGGSQQALCAFANGANQESGVRWANPACSDPASDRTLPVGTLGQNKFGLKDMIGNVAEWTLDCNTLNLRDAPANGEADLRGSCGQRATRGGSWFSGPADLRYSARLMQRRGDSNDFTGFRVVRKIAN